MKAKGMVPLVLFERKEKLYQARQYSSFTGECLICDRESFHFRKNIVGTSCKNTVSYIIFHKVINKTQ